MKRIIELTPRERVFLSEIKNNPRLKEHERECAQNVLRLDKMELSDWAAELIQRDREVFERLNQKNVILAESMLSLLKGAYPNAWAVSGWVDQVSESDDSGR